MINDAGRTLDSEGGDLLFHRCPAKSTLSSHSCPQLLPDLRRALGSIVMSDRSLGKTGDCPGRLMTGGGGTELWGLAKRQYMPITPQREKVALQAEVLMVAVPMQKAALPWWQ